MTFSNLFVDLDERTIRLHFIMRHLTLLVFLYKEADTLHHRVVGNSSSRRRCPRRSGFQSSNYSGFLHFHQGQTYAQTPARCWWFPHRDNLLNIMVHQTSSVDTSIDRRLRRPHGCRLGSLSHPATPPLTVSGIGQLENLAEISRLATRWIDVFSRIHTLNWTIFKCW